MTCKTIEIDNARAICCSDGKKRSGGVHSTIVAIPDTKAFTLDSRKMVESRKEK